MNADSLAVVLEQPERLRLARVDLPEPADDEVIVDIDYSGISTGTERLLWSGRMPAFPGMGYPLVPGYESVGRVRAAGEKSGRSEGEHVFVPGAACFGEIRGLFGGAASRLVVPGRRVLPIGPALGERGVLLALAATAYHATLAKNRPPDLVVGHGVLGRLVARLAMLAGTPAPVVWERDASRRAEPAGYRVIDPADDERHDYESICDVSGDPSLLDSLIARLAKGGEVVLAGFYDRALSFQFPPAFMREARIRVAAEWQPEDLAAVRLLVERGDLSLDGLITHCEPADEAPAAYRTAFGDPACLKMILDWRECR